jgi:hypothetical protein
MPSHINKPGPITALLFCSIRHRGRYYVAMDASQAARFEIFKQFPQFPLIGSLIQSAQYFPDLSSLSSASGCTRLLVHQSLEFSSNHLWSWFSVSLVSISIAAQRPVVNAVSFLLRGFLGLLVSASPRTVSGMPEVTTVLSCAATDLGTAFFLAIRGLA